VTFVTTLFIRFKLWRSVFRTITDWKR
jgi:hypothetical protein